MGANENTLIALGATLRFPLGNSTTGIRVSLFEFGRSWNHDTTQKMIVQEFGNRNVIALQTRDGIDDIRHEFSDLLVIEQTIVAVLIGFLTGGRLYFLPAVWNFNLDQRRWIRHDGIQQLDILRHDVIALVTIGLLDGCLQ